MGFGENLRWDLTEMYDLGLTTFFIDLIVLVIKVVIFFISEIIVDINTFLGLLSPLFVPENEINPFVDML